MLKVDLRIAGGPGKSNGLRKGDVMYKLEMVVRRIDGGRSGGGGGGLLLECTVGDGWRRGAQGRRSVIISKSTW